MQIHIDNMTCGHCVKSVTEAIHAVDPLAQVEIDLTDKRVAVTSAAAASAITAALDDAGYPPRTAV
ncbi:copper chaperone [Loktanella fryxellensis]|uniref:Copper chaperone n=1 Tax=Loktanella fryxellensis TaxID=245187 RepID=A0A1H8JQC0_9RHOB|nr:heavy-metal-associated domain-containing protein [Loktanella fryxellensis]SEN82705.1 copper chaperone [Loktanella fryxellensis]